MVACAPTTVYANESGTPWYESRTRLTSVKFLADMAGLALLHMCYWLYSYNSIVSLKGIGNLGGVLG